MRPDRHPHCGSGRECRLGHQPDADEVALAVSGHSGVTDACSHPVRSLRPPISPRDRTRGVCRGIREPHLLRDELHSPETEGENEEHRWHERCELGGDASRVTAVGIAQPADGAVAATPRS